MLLNMPIDLKVDGGFWYDKKAKRKPTIEEILNEEDIDCTAEDVSSVVHRCPFGLNVTLGPLA